MDEDRETLASELLHEIKSTSKRWFILFIISLIILFITNLCWLYAWNLPYEETTTTAQTQKVLDAIQQNKIDTLQAQVNQLQLQSAMCGVVRYPNASTYTAGFGPFYNQSCCNNTCNI